MALPMVPIYTQTVGAGGAASVTFNNIPQYYTDLKVVMSARCSAANNFQQVYLRANGITTSVYSDTRIYGYAGNVYSTRDTSTSIVANWTSGSSATSNTFGSYDIYIPNYVSSNYKSIIFDTTSENNNSTEVVTGMVAGLYRETTAISSLTLIGESSFVQYSTFSLYGILRAGA